jgi:hypothetical protein
MILLTMILLTMVVSSNYTYQRDMKRLKTLKVTLTRPYFIQKGCLGYWAYKTLYNTKIIRTYLIGFIGARAFLF